MYFLKNSCFYPQAVYFRGRNGFATSWSIFLTWKVPYLIIFRCLLLFFFFIQKFDSKMETSEHWNEGFGRFLLSYGDVMHTRRSASKFYPMIMCITTSMAFREYEFLSKQRQPPPHPRESYHKMVLDQPFYGGSRTIRLYISVRRGIICGSWGGSQGRDGPSRGRSGKKLKN